MSNPLTKIPNIEEEIQNQRQMTAEEEQAMIKAPYYAMKAKMEIAFESVFVQLYATVVEKNEQIKHLTLELAEFRKVTKTQPNVTVKDVKSPPVPTHTG